MPVIEAGFIFSTQRCSLNAEDRHVQRYRGRVASPKLKSQPDRLDIKGVLLLPPREMADERLPFVVLELEKRG